MNTDTYDRFVWIILGLVLIGLCAVSVSCRTADEFRAAVYSTRIGYELGDGSYDSRGGKAQNDSDYQAITASFAPFAWQGMKMSADLNARAATEAQYAERPPPPGPVLPVGPPTPCVEAPK